MIDILPGEVNFVVDRESDSGITAGYRVVNAIFVNGGFEKGIDKIRSSLPHIYKDVVQFVNPKTGKTEKGPKYDTTEESIKGRTVKDLLQPGVQQKEPIDAMKYEPRDKFQENKNMSDVKEKFQRIVRECMDELKKEDPRERLKESLRPMIKRVLGEIANIHVKEVDNEKAEIEKVRKGYNYDRQSYYHKDGGPERLNVTNKDKEEELSKLVKDIDGSWDVYWDDRNDLNIDAKNCGRVRITPKFENNFDIDFMWKLVDRIRAIALTWEQVKTFVKVNLKNLKGAEGNKTIADKKREQALANYVDDDKKKDAGPRWDVINNRGEKNNGEDAKIKDTPKKNKDYNEPAVKKDEDQPDQHMKDVTKPGEDPEGKNKNIEKTPQVKPPKHKNDNTLKLKELPKTKKFKSRKS